MSDEVWKAIKGYEGLYEVSNLGRVRSLDHYASNGSAQILYRGKILSPNMGTNGYYSVQLCKNNNPVRKMIHRLVAQAFIPPVKGCDIVNHKDENRTNNRADNLEWCDIKYNTNYGTGMSRLSRIKRGVPNPKKYKRVLCIGTGRIYQSVKDASISTGVNRTAISMVLSGKRKKAGGYMWKVAKQ